MKTSTSIAATPSPRRERGSLSAATARRPWAMSLLLLAAAAAPLAHAADAEPLALRFALNAFLVPALDDDADALPRWVDPRPVARCGPATDVRVDGRPLVVGAAVPATAFVIAWRADDCRPFGAAGPAYSGDVRLTVFHDEQGMSAVVEPAGLSERHAQARFDLSRSFGVAMPLPQPPGGGAGVGEPASRVAARDGAN
jgi:hypothetical protein